MEAKKNLKNVAAYSPGKPIEELKREKKLATISKLASNELPFAPFQVKKAVLAEFKNINRYPESSCFYLRQKLAQKLKVSRESLVFSNGSDELIVLLLKAFLEKGDEVIVSFPSFLIYEIQSRIFGAKIIKVPMENYRYCLEKIAEKISSKTKIIFIANPDNPTGTYLNHHQISEFIKKVSGRAILFFDEAYFEFAPPDFPRSLQLLKKNSNIVVARTFSKAYGLAGLRIGYGISSQKITAALNKVREPFNVNRFAQAAALAALDDKAFLFNTVKLINSEKEYIYRNLEKLNLNYLKSATNFILIEFGPKTAAFYRYLLNNGVIVRNMKSWGLDNFFRVTIGTPGQNKKFIRLLKNYQKNLK